MSTASCSPPRPAGMDFARHRPSSSLHVPSSVCSEQTEPGAFQLQVRLRPPQQAGMQWHTCSKGIGKGGTHNDSTEGRPWDEGTQHSRSLNEPPCFCTRFRPRVLCRRKKRSCHRAALMAAELTPCAPLPPAAFSSLEKGSSPHTPPCSPSLTEQLFVVTHLRPRVIGVTISASLPLLAAVPICLPHTWTLPARRLGAGSAASPTPMHCPLEPDLPLAEADLRPSADLSSCWCQADSQAQLTRLSQPRSSRCRHTAQPTPVPITTGLHPRTKPTLLLPGLRAGGALPSSSIGFSVGTVLTGSISVPAPFIAARYDMFLRLRLSIPPPSSSVSPCTVTLGTDARFCPEHAA